ncbi:type VII secretion protein EccB [Micromonospora echinaurantiaca]|uniref:type VII secretion protein EccB n=1 Tax=Micromonospora echinaurantiaca TaxID=47857 RepID=UPI0037A1E5F0
MPTRRDQLQAYQLAVRRVVNAFLAGDPDPAESPVPNGVGLLMGSVMGAVLIAAGVALVAALGR